MVKFVSEEKYSTELWYAIDVFMRYQLAQKFVLPVGLFSWSNLCVWSCFGPTVVNG